MPSPVHVPPMDPETVGVESSPVEDTHTELTEEGVVVSLGESDTPWEGEDWGEKEKYEDCVGVGMVLAESGGGLGVGLRKPDNVPKGGEADSRVEGEVVTSAVAVGVNTVDSEALEE